MTRDIVVLLHGIFRGRKDMWPLQKYLERQGFIVLNIDYPARKNTLEELSGFLHGAIRSHPKYDDKARMNFVTHSMGGLLARYYIRNHCPQKLGRIVMMGPPSTGSEWADFMSGHKWLRHAYRIGFGPAGAQMLTTHIHDCAGDICEVGIIAGRKSAFPFASRILPGDHDGLVAVERTRLPEMKDHIVMDATHTYMIMKPAVLRQVTAFLQNGSFSRD